MNVLHVMPSLERSYGGPVTALVGYVAAGTMGGIRSTVIGPRAPQGEIDWLRTRLPGITVVAPRSIGAGPWSGALGVLPAMRDLLEETDVVHVHGLLNPTSSGAARLAIAARRPVVIGPFGTLSAYTFSHRRRLAKRAYFRVIDAPSLGRASALHFTTAAELAEASDRGVAAGDRAYVVPPPYEPSPASAPRPVGTADPLVVLYLGRLDPKKGVEVLIDSWPYVMAQCPGAQLRIAGSGPARYATSLRRRAAAVARGMEAIQFLGFVEGAAKQRQLDEAALFVLASHHENFGIAVLDAVAAGVPVVVSTGVQLAPWVTEQNVGRVVSRDPVSIGRAIVEALSDAGWRTHVAATGRAAVARAFAPVAVAPALQAMYQGALGHSPTSR